MLHVLTGAELQLQRVNLRNFNLTRRASDLLAAIAGRKFSAENVAFMLPRGPAADAPSSSYRPRQRRTHLLWQERHQAQPRAGRIEHRVADRGRYRARGRFARTP